MIFNLVSPATSVEEIFQGDTVNWIFNLPSYPNDQWTGQMVFVQLGSKVGAPVNAVADLGDVSQWLVTVDAVASAKLPIGGCEVYMVMLSNASPQQRVSVFCGHVTIVPNPMATMPPSSNMVALTAVQKTINTVLSQPEQSASFNGQTYTLWNIKDLFDIRNQLMIQVDGELRSAGLVTKSSFHVIQNRFV